MIRTTRTAITMHIFVLFGIQMMRRNYSRCNKRICVHFESAALSAVKRVLQIERPQPEQLNWIPF